MYDVNEDAHKHYDLMFIVLCHFFDALSLIYFSNRKIITYNHQP